MIFAQPTFLPPALEELHDVIMTAVTKLLQIAPEELPIVFADLGSSIMKLRLCRNSKRQIYEELKSSKVLRSMLSVLLDEFYLWVESYKQTEMNHKDVKLNVNGFLVEVMSSLPINVNKLRSNWGARIQSLNKALTEEFCTEWKQQKEILNEIFAKAGKNIGKLILQSVSFDKLKNYCTKIEPEQKQKLSKKQTIKAKPLQVTKSQRKKIVTDSEDTQDHTLDHLEGKIQKLIRSHTEFMIDSGERKKMKKYLAEKIFIFMENILSKVVNHAKISNPYYNRQQFGDEFRYFSHRNGKFELEASNFVPQFNMISTKEKFSKVTYPNKLQFFHTLKFKEVQTERKLAVETQSMLNAVENRKNQFKFLSQYLCQKEEWTQMQPHKMGRSVAKKNKLKFDQRTVAFVVSHDPFFKDSSFIQFFFLS